VTAVKKWWRRRSVRAALGHGEKRRRAGRGAVEDSKDGKAAAAEEVSATVTEGARELEREGKRGGEGRGCTSPFIGLGGRQRWPG
jgi:hypothetical protein